MRAGMILAGALLALSAATAQAQSDGVSGQITVSGEAVVTAAPDMATITLGAEGRGDTPAQALNSTSAALDAMIVRLIAEGVEPRDMQTSTLQLGPDQYWDRERQENIQRGYLAQNTLSVRIRDLPRLGEVLSMLVDDGANTMYGVSFGLQDSKAIENEARRLAVKDAIDKAGVYAGAAGLALGPVLTLSDGSSAVAPVFDRAMMKADMVVAEAAPVPVAAGEISARASVTIVFAIGE